MDSQIITQQTLEDAGIDLTGEDVLALLAHLNDIVEERISTKVTDTLTEEQMKTMLALQDDGSDQDLAVWMKKHVPKMDTLVQGEVDRLIDEIIDTDDEE